MFLALAHITSLLPITRSAQFEFFNTSGILLAKNVPSSVAAMELREVLKRSRIQIEQSGILS